MTDRESRVRRPFGRIEIVLAARGVVLAADGAAAAFLGVEPGEVAGLAWSRIYTLEARERIGGLVAAPSPLPRVLPLSLKGADGTIEPVIAVCESLGGAGEETRLVLNHWPAGGELDDLAALVEANEVLDGIVAASSDAGWCMEWADPVDLSAPEHEIVRQVFENGPRWRFCNDAMARLYRAPSGAEFNDRPVRDTFPRSPENEDFIRRLVRADFDVNGSPSRDLRYDGVFIDVENDVRGHIRGNRLHRMWGTVRDVSKHVRRESELRDEIAFLEAVLAALPDPVLVADRDGTIHYMNLAAEALFEVPAERATDARLDDVLGGLGSVERLIADARISRAATARDPFIAFARLPGGEVRVEGTAQTFDLRGDTMIAVCLRHVPRAVERGALLAAGGRER